MKVLLSYSNYSGLVGGVEVYARSLCRIFRDLKIVDYQSFKSELGDAFFPFFREPKRAMLLGKLVQKKFEEIDLAITNGMFCWNLGKTPQINVCHGTYAGLAKLALPRTSLDFYRLSFIYNHFEKKAAKNADKVVANSKQTKGLVKEFFGLNSCLIYPPVDIDVFKPVNQQKALKKLGWQGTNVLFVGRPERAKGFNFVEYLAKTNPEINFRCVLSRPYISSLKNLFVYGSVKHENLAFYYNASDLVFFPSLFEGFGIVAAEALACNKKLLSFGAGFLSEEGFEETLKSSPSFDIIQRDFKHALESPVIKLRSKIKSNFSFQVFKKRWLDVVDK